MFISGLEANKAIKNSLLKERKMDAFIRGFLTKRKGVIQGVPDDVPLKEIQEIVENENDIKVVNMFRLKKRNKVTKKWEDSSSVCVELRGNALPEYIKMWKVRIPVLPYIPLVRICFKCSRIGHIAKTCENKERCLTCGESRDRLEKDKCTVGKKCINCQGDHTLDRSCPAFIRHTAIIRTMALENISFSEARNKIDKVSRINVEDNRYLMKTPEQYPYLPARSNVPGFSKDNISYASRVISAISKTQLLTHKRVTSKKSTELSAIITLILDALEEILPKFTGKEECIKTLRAKCAVLQSSLYQEETGLNN